MNHNRNLSIFQLAVLIGVVSKQAARIVFTNIACITRKFVSKTKTTRKKIMLLNKFVWILLHILHFTVKFSPISTFFDKGIF